MTEFLAPDFLVLHEADNVATALRDVPSGQPARVAGAHGPLSDVTPVVAIRLGHKIAIREIQEAEFVVKQGQPIGRATAAIAIGQHVHVHNVISLSRETDLAVGAPVGRRLTWLP
jgi:altronate hydrolase